MERWRGINRPLETSPKVEGDKQEGREGGMEGRRGGGGHTKGLTGR